MIQLAADIKNLSTYRTPLMGIATLMIIMCHAPASGVVMPKFLARVCDQGNYGVDLFLLLSGLGVYYSQCKQPVKNLVGGVIWYRKRFARVLIPYMAIYVPYCIIQMLLGNYTFADSLLCLTTLEYWIFHRGAWFVSLILVLYLLSPFLYHLLETKWKWIYVLVIITGIIIICNWSELNTIDNGLTRNILFALSRVPCFVLGIALGDACRHGKRISLLWLILLVALYIVCVKVFVIYEGLSWMLVPLMSYLLVLFLEMLKNIKWIVNMFSSLGKISLESYLTNITINSILMTLIPTFIVSPLFYGRWLEYSIVIILGLIIASVLKKFSTKMQQVITTRVN